MGFSVAPSILLLCSLIIGQQTTSTRPSPNLDGLCEQGALLPRDIQSLLTLQFNSFHIERPPGLGPRAFTRWQSETPLQCPGLAVGWFEIRSRSYAVLLVSKNDAKKAYKFVVFTPTGAQPPYETRVLDSDTTRAGNSFIRTTMFGKFFDKTSVKKFHAYTRDGILIVDSAENEYEVDVYFWADGTYQHQPLDY